MICVRPLAALGVLVVASSSAWAQEPEPPASPAAAFSGSTSARVEWRGNNRNERTDDDRFGAAIMRTNLALDGGNARFAVRFDGEGFVRPPPGAGHEDQLRIERLSLDLDRTFAPGRREVRVHLSLGDFYAQLGRGLALSLRRIDDLGIDAGLRGVRVDVGAADGRLALVLLGGITNTVNIDQQYLRHLDEPRDRLAGARLEGRLGELALGLHAAGVRDVETAVAASRRQTVNFGGTLDLALGGVDLGLEVNGQRRQAFGAQEEGWAAYGVATVPLGRVTILAEAKHYVRFLPLTGSSLSTGEGRFLYSQPPTAERIDQELVDNTDVTGGRLRADLGLGSESVSSLHGNVGLFRNRATGQWVTHAFAGVDLRGSSGIAVLTAGGYRREWLAANGALVRAIAHGELDAILPVTERFSLHGIAQHESHAEATGAARYVFHRGGASLEADFGDRLALALGVDWDTQNRAPGVANGFGFGLVRWRQSDAFIVQVLAGSQRGGIRCIAGACRIQPPFAGARLDITALY